MRMRGDLISPTMRPSARISTRSLTTILPVTWPSTCTVGVWMSASTTPSAAMVTVDSRLMRPLTVPSTMTGSVPEISPSITVLRPIMVSAMTSYSSKKTMAYSGDDLQGDVHIDVALKASAFFDDDTRGAKIARDLRSGQEGHDLPGNDFAIEAAAHGDGD